MDDDNEYRRFKHWGPILLLSLTLFVTCTTLHMNSMWWPPGQDWGSLVNFGLIWVHVFATLYNFVRSLMVGPGFVPKNWHPERLKDTEFLQFCQRCEGYKPPRSHHCRRCDRCVLKMDHHCPWINNCVGWSNQVSYMYFLLFFLSASVQAGFIISAALIRGLGKRYFINQNLAHLATVNLTLLNCVACIVTLAVAMGMGMASLKLLYMQAKVVFTNKTEIERWIIKKAQFRRNAYPGKRIKPLVYPYDLGWRGNYQEAFVPSGDGYSWPVLPGCHQYTLTVEQLAQKQYKRSKTRSYKCIRPVTGHWFPIISQGLLVSLQIPWNDDPRIALQRGDLVQVTRDNNCWLYGERVISAEEMVEGKKRRGAIRGWFPGGCAKEILCEDSETENNVFAGGEPFLGKNKADEKLADQKYYVLVDRGVQTENQELKTQEKHTLEQILNEKILWEDSETEENVFAGGEPFPGKNKAIGKLADEKNDVLAGEEGVQNENQELKTIEDDPYFKRTLEQILKENYDNLEDEKPPWEEEEHDFGELSIYEDSPWKDGTRQRAL